MQKRRISYSSFPKYILYAVLVFVFLFAFGFQVFAAWTPPTVAPPLGNVPAPINVGPTSQTKDGNLVLNFLNASANGLIVYSGNVGIGLGALSPNTILDMLGAFSVRGMALPAPSPAGQGRIYFDSTLNKFRVSQSGGGYVDLVGAGGTLPSGISGQTLRHDGTNWIANSVLFNNGTNVGIGTTAPAQKLDVSGGSIQWGSAASSLTGLLSTAGSPAYITIGSNSPRSVALVTGSGEVMRLESGGNVGIGDSTPLALFTVGSGDLFRVDSSGNLIRINNVPYSWPSSQGAAGTVLTNNGSGGLSWGTVGGGDITGVTAGSGLTGGGASGDVTLDVGAGTGITVGADSISVNTAVIQSRVSGTCAVGSSVRVVNADGTVSCETDDVGVVAETDPQVGAVTSGQWCRADGSAVQCDQAPPGGGGHVSGGLYGYCSWQDPAVCPYFASPAMCDPAVFPTFARCSCPVGYTLITISVYPAGGAMSTCYKN